MRYKKILLFPITFIGYLLIGIYKIFISPFLSHTCKFYPSCSTYSFLALKNFDLISASKLICKRFYRCASSKYKGGFDPIPVNIKGESKWIL